MRLSIRHSTRFVYTEPATASFNEVRLAPRNDEHQNVLSFELSTDPAASVTSYVDHYGTLVHAFNIWPEHTSLTVTGISAVVTYPRIEPLSVPGDLQQLREYAVVDRQAEWLHPSPLASGGDPLASFADHVHGVVQADSAYDLVRGVCDEVHRRFPYTSGTSFVSSTVDDLLERGTGVCQDFAHLAIATLRRLGVPARYVSGYFHASTEPEPDQVLDLESHAWIQAMVPGFGWLEFDPTNNCLADERHVIVAVGRDYADVAPLRGVLTGGGGQRLEVSVTMVTPGTVSVESGPTPGVRPRSMKAKQQQEASQQ